MGSEYYRLLEDLANKTREMKDRHNIDCMLILRHPEGKVVYMVTDAFQRVSAHRRFWQLIEQFDERDSSKPSASHPKEGYVLPVDELTKKMREMKERHRTDCLLVMRSKEGKMVHASTAAFRCIGSHKQFWKAIEHFDERDLNIE